MVAIAGKEIRMEESIPLSCQLRLRGSFLRENDLSLLDTKQTINKYSYTFTRQNFEVEELKQPMLI